MPRKKTRQSDNETGLGEVGENIGETVENASQRGIQFFSEIGQTDRGRKKGRSRRSNR